LTNDNTALGDDALVGNITGFQNTATGFKVLFSNTYGHENTATGYIALFNNTTGYWNTANGASSLFSNTTGYSNTATAVSTLAFNTTGFANTANGAFALCLNTIGSQNTASGVSALFANTTGYDNTATGFSALANNTNGAFNTATGEGALSSNTIGINNTANGVNALGNNYNGSNNIALGYNAGVTLVKGDNDIDIGSDVARAGESRTIRIGTTPTHVRTFIAGISGVTVAGGVGVIIDANGQLGTVVSSNRFKDDIKAMDRASEAILALKPVTFRYKHELDPKGIPQFGLVAEDVEKVNPDLVARDEKGKPYTVRYEAVNAMLLNEFLKEHQTVQELKKQVAELTAGLQKVNAQLELSKTAPQTVLNSH